MAEDILQDVFAKIQKRLGQLQDPAKLEGWLYLIARNAIIDHIGRGDEHHAQPPHERVVIHRAASRCRSHPAACFTNFLDRL